MVSLNGVSAWIEVDGKELEQHGIEEDHDRRRVTCWIATQADKCFSVVFRNDVTYRDHSLASNLDLDGTFVPGVVLRLPARTTDGLDCSLHRTAVQKDQVLSVTSSCPFMFAKLELTDEDLYLDQASRHLGEIRIHILRVQALERCLFQSGSSVAGHGKVHERSKKAVTHCVSYGQEVSTATQYTRSVRYLDGKVPLATFIFKYRDSSLLQANGIIPKPPPAMKKAAVHEAVLDLTTGNGVKSEPVWEEIDIIDDATRKRTGALSERLHSSHEGGARPTKRIKREKKRVPAGEIIDLT